MKEVLSMQNKQVASFMEASGTIRYNMTNNYMFRYILQKNKKVEITNPINLSGDVTGKEFILDINVMLNVKNHLLYSDKFTLSVVNLSKPSEPQPGPIPCSPVPIGARRCVCAFP